MMSLLELAEQQTKERDIPAALNSAVEECARWGFVEVHPRTTVLRLSNDGIALLLQYRQAMRALKRKAARGDSSVEFDLLAFELLGIKGLPSPRTDAPERDPYLTKQQFRALAHTVCELIPGYTIGDWDKASNEQRTTDMAIAIRKREDRFSDGGAA